MAVAPLRIGVAMWDAQVRLMTANPRFYDMFGISAAQFPAHPTLADVIRSACGSGALAGREPDELIILLSSLVGADEAVGWNEQWPDGRLVAMEFHPAEAGTWLLTCEDITERQLVQSQLRFLGQHDGLTKLVNYDCLKQHLDQSMRRGHPVAVLCIDFDRFKDFNDRVGHQVGDALLQQAGSRLGSVFRQGDLVGRLGSDEFAVILTGSKGREQALACAASVIALLSQPFEIAGRIFRVSASIGVAIGPRDGTDARTLLVNAELALRAAKAAGLGQVVPFAQSMADRLNTRRQMEADLHLALTRDELTLFYQPIVDAVSGQVVSFEALIRWVHPVRGMVSPAEFIPVAEATGLIIPIGTWVLRRACADAARWPAHVSVAVNLSGAQFGAGNLTEDVHTALARAELSPNRLELEITESLLIKDSQAARHVLAALRAIGVRVAIDDFGTGYSSLSYLRDFAFDKIKIDKSFVDDLGQNRNSDAVIRAVTRLATDLGVKTVAEGVETDQQRARLCADGCSFLQGFLFSRPARAETVPALITRLDLAHKTQDGPSPRLIA